MTGWKTKPAPTCGGLAFLGSDRTEWEAVAGTDDGSLRVVRPLVYSHCGLMLAVLLPLTLLWLGRPKAAALGPASAWPGSSCWLSRRHWYWPPRWS